MQTEIDAEGLWIRWEDAHKHRWVYNSTTGQAWNEWVPGFVLYFEHLSYCSLPEPSCWKQFVWKCFDLESLHEKEEEESDFDLQAWMQQVQRRIDQRRFQWTRALYAPAVLSEAHVQMLASSSSFCALLQTFYGKCQWANRSDVLSQALTPLECLQLMARTEAHIQWNATTETVGVLEAWCQVLEVERTPFHASIQISFSRQPLDLSKEVVHYTDEIGIPLVDALFSWYHVFWHHTQWWVAAYRDEHPVSMPVANSSSSSSSSGQVLYLGRLESDDLFLAKYVGPVAHCTLQTYRLYLSQAQPVPNMGMMVCEISQTRVWRSDPMSRVIPLHPNVRLLEESQLVPSLCSLVVSFRDLFCVSLRSSSSVGIINSSSSSVVDAKT